jgi:hypothetical protein
MKSQGKRRTGLHGLEKRAITGAGDSVDYMVEIPNRLVAVNHDRQFQSIHGGAAPFIQGFDSCTERIRV